MALSSESDVTVGHEYPIATELAAVVGVLVALSVWQFLFREVLLPAVGFTPGGSGVDSLGGFLVAGVVTGGLFVGGAAAMVAVYATVRDIEVRFGFPTAKRLPTVAGVASVPIALVGVTKLVGALTGTAYSTLVLRSYGGKATVGHAVATTTLTAVVAVPVLLVVCQVLMQGSFRRVADDATAAALTTLVAGFLLVDPDGGTLEALPERGKVFGAVLFVAALAVALYGRKHLEATWLRRLSVVPVGLFVAGTLLSTVAAIGTVAAGVFVSAQLGTLSVAAYGYERAESLLAPAVAYVGFLVASEAVIFLLEAGVQNW